MSYTSRISRPNRRERIETLNASASGLGRSRISRPNRRERIETFEHELRLFGNVGISRPNRRERIETTIWSGLRMRDEVSPGPTAGSGLKHRHHGGVVSAI